MPKDRGLTRAENVFFTKIKNPVDLKVNGKFFAFIQLKTVSAYLTAAMASVP